MVHFADVEGKCVMTDVPLAPFTDWKSGQVDIIAVSRAGTFVRRAALQNSFTKIRPSTATQDKIEEEGEKREGKGKDDDQKKGEKEVAFSATGSTRFFLASVHLKLLCSSPSKSFIQANEMCQGEVVVTAVGSSSYSLVSNLAFPPSSSVEGGATAVPLGVGQVTYVRIDPATRKATPLDSDHKAGILSYINEERNQAEGHVKMERLVPPPTIKSALGSLASDPGSADVVISSTETAIRYSDTDFNGHTNQLTYITLAVDALRCHLESSKVYDTATTGTLPHPGEGRDVAEVRIDYLNEVRDVGTKVTTTLLQEAQIPEEDAEAKKKFWFAISFVPSGKTAPTIATLGYVVRQ